jgi:hypothetical protein
VLLSVGQGCLKCQICQEIALNRFPQRARRLHRSQIQEYL